MCPPFATKQNWTPFTPMNAKRGETFGPMSRKSSKPLTNVAVTRETAHRTNRCRMTRICIDGIETKSKKLTWLASSPKRKCRKGCRD